MFFSPIGSFLDIGGGEVLGLINCEKILLLNIYKKKIAFYELLTCIYHHTLIIEIGFVFVFTNA